MATKCRDGITIQPGDLFYIASEGEVHEMTVERIVFAFESINGVPLDPPNAYILVGEMLIRTEAMIRSRELAIRQHLREIDNRILKTDREHMDLLNQRQRLIEALGHDVLATSQAVS